ncbi:hypothetical protein KGF54_000273 [Candida jiufengensis]|uniref:uncharacterized protein n=1 Tax=Candida jiufengensis TaxID=497108 RepID=UPI002224F528|nr:uncharacterized protein KGF54_000273 [Candida jiufengensis]KAI5957345.1 hypothetical protein KGF54_000273 [Candida jiufengensis]
MTKSNKEKFMKNKDNNPSKSTESLTDIDDQPRNLPSPNQSQLFPGSFSTNSTLSDPPNISSQSDNESRKIRLPSPSSILKINESSNIQTQQQPQLGSTNYQQQQSPNQLPSLSLYSSNPESSYIPVNYQLQPNPGNLPLINQTQAQYAQFPQQQQQQPQPLQPQPPNIDSSSIISEQRIYYQQPQDNQPMSSSSHSQIPQQTSYQQHHQNFYSSQLPQQQFQQPPNQMYQPQHNYPTQHPPYQFESQSQQIYQNPNFPQQPNLISLRRKSKQSTTWTPEEDALLRYLKEELKYGWSRISSYYGGSRSSFACQFRWRRIISAERANLNSNPNAKQTTDFTNEGDNLQQNLLRGNPSLENIKTDATTQIFELSQTQAHHQSQEIHQLDKVKLEKKRPSNDDENDEDHDKKKQQHNINFLLN